MFGRIKHIHSRFTISVSLLIIGTILITSFLISYLYSREMIKQTVVITEQKMDIIIQSLEEEVDIILELQNKIQGDNQLQELMTTHDKMKTLGQDNSKEISELLRQYSYDNTSVNSIFYFDMNQEILDPLYQLEPYSKIVNEFEPFDEFVASKKNSSFSIPTNFPSKSYNIDENITSTFTYFSNYIDINNFVQIGYLLINVNKNSVFKNFTRLCESEFDYVIIEDHLGRTIVEVGNIPNSISDNQLLKNNTNEFIQSDDLKTYVITKPLKVHKDWKVIGGISYDNLLRENLTIGKIILLICIISILFVIMISFFLSKNITKPIIEVSKSMETLEYGHWPDPVKAKSNDELNLLVQGYNKMVIDLKNYIDIIEQEKNEKAEFEINNLKLRLELLQSQINPHFVHNTLNGIKYLAKTKDTDELVNLIESFNLLLRASMTIDTDFISIDGEVECVKNFLNIFRVRYDDHIDMIINVDDDIHDYMIPKLILQPIVENAAYHGILASGKDGTIELTLSKKNDNYISVIVSDNGLGMEASKVEELMHNNFKPLLKKRTTSKGFNNIGLNNINDRLSLYFGDNCKLDMISQLNIGTRISFIMPILSSNDVQNTNQFRNTDRKGDLRG